MKTLIFDSVFWKDELKTNYQGILKYNDIALLNENFEETYNHMEKHIFLSAFIIRKLVESKKLTDAVDNYEKQIIGFAPLKEITRLNRFEIFENYNLEDSKLYTVKFKNICNWLIHSYVCQLNFDDSDRVIGFYISSDYDRNKIMYNVQLEDWLDYINRVIDDEIAHIEFRYCRKKGNFIIKIKE